MDSRVERLPPQGRGLGEVAGPPLLFGLPVEIGNGLGRRIDMPAGLAAWQMPQGGIDRGETPEQAAMRELHEEVGTDKAEILGVSEAWHHYELPGQVSGRMWGGRYRGQRQRWFAMRFLGEDGEIRLDHDPHPEFDAWRWVPLVELPALAVGFKRPIYEVLAEAFAPFAGR